MQKAFINSLSEICQQNADVIFMTADNGTDFDPFFERSFPGQYYNMGISECNMVGAAAGMALCGKIPFVYTAAPFLAFRAFEFIRNDVCMQNANVKLIGMGSGFSISMLGSTHHTIEDIGVLRAIPMLTIFSPATPLEVGACVKIAAQMNGPVYIRLGMNGEREFYPAEYEFEPFRNETIKNGNDILIFTTGSIASEVLSVSKRLEEKGVSACVVNVHTLKPFNEEECVESMKKFHHVFTVEEHTIVGGLFSILSECIAKNAVDTKLTPIGIEDQFAKGYGSRKDLLEMNGLGEQAILEKIMIAYGI